MTCPDRRLAPAEDVWGNVSVLIVLVSVLLASMLYNAISTVIRAFHLAKAIREVVAVKPHERRPLEDTWMPI